MKRFKQHLDEASYAGNIGIMELIKFKNKASQEDRKKFDDLVKNKRHKEAWELVQKITVSKLHSSVHEEKKSPNPDILPKAGAGQWGTDELLKTYIKDTPGQKKTK